jgi:hypothetical protein
MAPGSASEWPSLPSPGRPSGLASKSGGRTSPSGPPINEGLRLWNLYTGTWRARQTYSFFPGGDPFISLGTATLTYGVRLEWENQAMHRSSIFELDYGRANWQAETTASPGTPSRPTLWAPVSLVMLAIWPRSLVDGTILVDGVAVTPILVDDADTVDLDEALQGILLGYALHACAFAEGGQRFQATMPFYQTFIKAAGEENADFKASSVYRKVMGLHDLHRQRPQRAMEPEPAFGAFDARA